jgi:hypothetical protein
MGMSHTFRGASGKEYEYLLHSVDNVRNDTMQPGTYILATSGTSEPGFLYCKEAHRLRQALTSERLPELRKAHTRLILYVRIDPNRDKAARKVRLMI